MSFSLKKELKLSSRLECLHKSLLENQAVWDFCCDHGELGLKAYLKKTHPEIFFVDKVQRIVDKLQLRFKNHFYNSKNPTHVFFVIGLGQEVDQIVSGNVVIAGVGAATILKILQGLSVKSLLQAQRLILAPQNHVASLVMQMPNLFESNFILQQKYMIEEKGRIRTILIFDRKK
jgi:tRNA (adenine22-N1)-methyltransferase